MDAIRKALSEVTFRIPRRILEVAFGRQKYNWRRTPVDISNVIMESVIKPRVLIDCDLVGGAEVYVPIDGIDPIITQQNNYVYQIPKDRTQGRTILSVLDLLIMDPTRNSYYSNTAFMGSSTTLQVAQSVMDAHAALPITSNARSQLIGENVILVTDGILPSPYAAFRCVIANDENLRHLQVRSYRHFSRLVELAVKSFIYNDLSIEMDAGQLMLGQELGAFKDRVESYSDAEEMYQTYLAENWQKVSFMQDRQGYTRFINSLFGAQR